MNRPAAQSVNRPGGTGAEGYLHGLAPILEWASRRAGNVCSAELVRQVVARTVSEQATLTPSRKVSATSTAAEPGDWANVFAKAAGSLRLRSHHHVMDIEMILRGLSTEMTAATYLGPCEEECAWIAISKKRSNRYIVLYRSWRKERRLVLSEKRAAAFVRSVGGGGEQSFIYLEPIFALRALGGSRPSGKHASPWVRLKALVFLERGGFWILFSHALVIGVLTLVTPVAIQSLVNTVAFGSLLQPLFMLTILLLGGLVFRAWIMTQSVWATEMLQRRVFVRITEDLGERLSRIHLYEHRSKDLPARMLRFFEVVAIQKSVSGLILDGLGLILQLVVGLTLLAFYHPLLLAFSLVIIALLAAVVVVFARGAIRTAIDESYAKYRTASWLHQIVSQPLMFRSTGGQDYASTRAQALCRDYLDARQMHFARLLRQFVGGFGLQVFAMVSLLGIGGFLVINRQLTLGQLVAAELVIGVTSVGFSKLGKHLEKVYDLLAGLDKVGTLIDLPLEHSGREIPHTSGAATLEVRDLVTHREAGPQLAIPYLDVHAGETVALMGDSGSGKSTFLEIVWGVREGYDGMLSVDGVEEKQADVSSWRDNVHLIRDPEFVHGTVWENLTVGNLSLRKQEVQAALEAVGMADRVRRLEAGLDTLLMPTGAPLSSTEKRLLMLARAILDKPRMLLLDGALDHLSMHAASKRALFDRLFGEDSPWTAIIVSADPEISALCARQLELDNGRVVEVGT